MKRMAERHQPDLLIFSQSSAKRGLRECDFFGKANECVIQLLTQVDQPHDQLIEDDDGFGKAIVDGATIRIDQGVEQSQTQQGQREDVAKGALHGLSSGRN